MFAGLIRLITSYGVVRGNLIVPICYYYYYYRVRPLELRVGLLQRGYLYNVYYGVITGTLISK